MRLPNPINLAMVGHVAKRLGRLCGSFVFVGGAVVDLLITDAAAPAVRPTRVVDVIVEVASLNDYYRLGDLLRPLGFREDHLGEGSPICRWVIDDIKVDILPVEGHVLGFSNKFYPVASSTAGPLEISEGLTIRLISAPCFLAAKFEAFADRGEGDFMGSPDMEDIIAVLDGRPEIVDEIRDSPDDVRGFLATALTGLLDDEDFLECLSGHLEFAGDAPGRVSLFLKRVRAISAIPVERSGPTNG